MTILLTVAGVSFLLLVAYDVYATVLDGRSRSGPVSEGLNHGVWRAARRIAFRLTRQRRHRMLSHVGPLLLPSLIISYIILLVCGFALIYRPHMPASFNFSHGRGQGDWQDSFYYSGVTLTTIGYGDITPGTPATRAVSLVEGAAGLAVISLTITYLITVYSALERKRAVALSFYHQAGEGADVAGFITHHYVQGRFYGLEGTLSMGARDLQALLESHVEHPIIHYFHPVEVYKSLPRILFLTLETCTVIHACVDSDAYPEIYHHPEVRTLKASSRHVLGALVDSLKLEPHARRKRTAATYEEARRWESRYSQTLLKLRRAGIKTRPDVQAGWEDYRANREEWESSLHRFATFLGYDWEEVTGDRDLEYAADENKEVPQAKDGTDVPTTLHTGT